jgi:stringent starvation protein B
MPVDLPPKKEVALALLQSSTVFIHLDPRVDDVQVPPWFRKQPQLVLQIGLNMPVPIPDLDLDDEQVSCTLSFNRSPFFCRIPWKAVFALIGEDRRGMVWPNDVPAEVAVQVQGQVREKQARAAAAERPHLRAVPATADAQSKAATNSSETDTLSARPEQRKRVSAGRKKRVGSKRSKANTSRGHAARASVPAETRGADGGEAAASAPAKRGAKRRRAGDAATEAKRAEGRQAGAPPLTQAGPAAKPQALGSKSSKRKLPPYLRVVK